MPAGTIATNISLGGISVQSNIVRTAAGQIGHEIALPAGKAGTLTTRTADNEGVATLSADHGITTGALVDVYWAAGVRYGMTVGTVDGVTVPLAAGGAGDVLPTAETALVIAPVTEIDTDFDGDLVEMLAALSNKRGHVDIRDSSDTIDARELAANEAWVWAADNGVTNPLASGLVDCVRVSNGDSSGAATAKVALLYNSDE